MEDRLVFKLATRGNVQWQRTCGADARDDTPSIQLTADGGYILAARTDPFGAHAGDFWFLKLDGHGNVQ